MNSPELKTTELEMTIRGLEREPTSRAVLLYSGGADSTAAGIILRDQGYTVFPVFFDYGQTALAAEQYLATIAPSHLGFEPTQIIKTDLLTVLARSGLLGGTAVDDASAWVPGRNTLLMLTAGIYAHQINADGIAVGYMRDDHGVFGDSSRLHHKMTEMLLTQTLSRPLAVYLPLERMGKIDVLQFLADRQALDLTVSCWNAYVENGRIEICHTCANCLERTANLRNIHDGNVPPYPSSTVGA